MVSAARIARLREELGADAAERVTFADMAEVGINPARIIPAWREFVDAHAGQRTPAAGHRRADLGRAQPRRARRVPAPRSAAQPGLRGRRGLLAAVPLRRRGPRARRHREGPPQPPGRGRGRCLARERDAITTCGAVAAPFDRAAARSAAGRRRASLRLGHAGRRAPAREAARRRRGLPGGAHRRPRARRQRGGDQLDPPRRRRGRAAHLAGRGCADLRGRRRRAHRRSARRAPAAGQRPVRRARPLAVQPDLRPGPAAHVRHAAASCGCTRAAASRRSPRAGARAASGRRSRRCGRTASSRGCGSC